MASVIIGLTGPKRGGKNTVAEMLMAFDPDFVAGAFADKLRAMALAVDPYVETMLSPNFGRLSRVIELLGWDNAKAFPDVRRLLQRMGTEMGRREIDNDFWVNAFNTFVTKELGADQSLVITDVRFTNEIDYVHQIGGTVWRINRPEAEDGDPHPSEREWRDAVPDLTIENTRTLVDLRASVRAALGLVQRGIVNGRSQSLEVFPPGYPIIRPAGPDSVELVGKPETG